MPFDVGLHWHLDDSNSILEPTIRTAAVEIPKGRYEGTVWDLMSAPERTVETSALDNFKFEIRDRSLTSLAGVVGNGSGTGWNNSATTSLPMPASAIGILTVGHVLQVESEQVVVKSVDRSGYTIDVRARGHGGTSAASHADTTAFTIIGQAISDTDAKNVESFAEQSGKYVNYTQTVFETIDQTFTDDIQARKAFEQNPQLVREALNRVRRKLERSSIRGRRQEPNKASLIPSGSAGLLHQLSDGGGARTALRYNVNGALTEDVIKAALDSIWNQGGNPDTIILSPTLKRLFDPLTEQFIRMGRQEARVAGTDNATGYQYQGVTLNFAEDIDMPSDRVAIVTRRQLKRGWRVGDMLRGPVREPTDSSRELRYSLQGSFFFEVYGVGVDHIDLYGVS